MKWMLTLPLLLFFTAAQADPEDWMKRNGADSLGLFISSQKACSYSNDEFVEIVEGEFLRARITPTKDLDLNLTLTIFCMPIENNNDEVQGSSVYIEMRFGTQLANGDFVLYENPNYGTQLVLGSGTQGKMFLKNALIDSVGSAITDFLKANLE